MPNMNPKKMPMPEQAPDVRNKNFDEVTLGYTPEMAIEEAQRCLNCKNKPCISGCPVQVKIPEFIALVAEGKFLLGGMMIEFPVQHRRADLTFDTALEDLSGRFTEITGFGMEGADGK